MMSIFVSLIGCIIEDFILLKAFEIFFELRRKYYIWIFLIVLVSLSFIFDTGKQPFLLVNWIIILFIYGVISFEKGKITQKIFFAFGCMGICFGVSIVSFGIFGLFSYQATALLGGDENAYIAIIIISKVLLIVTYLMLKKIKQLYILTGKQWITFTLAFIILFLSLINNFEIFKQNENASLLCSMAIFYIFSLYTVLLFLFLTKSKDNQEIEQRNMEIKMLDANRNISIQTLKAYEENRKLKHNLNHQLIVLLDKLNHENKEDLKAYIEAILKISTSSEIVQTKNKALNNILNYYAMKMKNHSIRFEHQIHHDLGFLDETDLAIIMGNLLDNAIEAQVNLLVDKVIRLSILEEGEIILRLENPCDNNHLREHKKTFLTTKINKESHGFGISSIKSIVKKNNGIFDMEVSNSTFITTIIFFNK